MKINRLEHRLSGIKQGSPSITKEELLQILRKGQQNSLTPLNDKQTLLEAKAVGKKPVTLYTSDGEVLVDSKRLIGLAEYPREVDLYIARGKRKVWFYPGTKNDIERDSSREGLERVLKAMTNDGSEIELSRYMILMWLKYCWLGDKKTRIAVYDSIDASEKKTASRKELYSMLSADPRYLYAIVKKQGDGFQIEFWFDEKSKDHYLRQHF